MCTGADGGEDRIVVVMHGHHEHVDSLRFVKDASGRVDAVEAGHVDVHHDDVGLVFGGQAYRFLTVGGLADDGRLR